jgi:hypothetical protein
MKIRIKIYPSIPSKSYLYREKYYLDKAVPFSTEYTYKLGFPIIRSIFDKIKSIDLISIKPLI